MKNSLKKVSALIIITCGLSISANAASTLSYLKIGFKITPRGETKSHSNNNSVNVSPRDTRGKKLNVENNVSSPIIYKSAFSRA